MCLTSNQHKSIRQLRSAFRGWRDDFPPYVVRSSFWHPKPAKEEDFVTSAPQTQQKLQGVKSLGWHCQVQQLVQLPNGKLQIFSSKYILCFFPQHSGIHLRWKIIKGKRISHKLYSEELVELNLTLYSPGGGGKNAPPLSLIGYICWRVTRSYRKFSDFKWTPIPHL